MFYTLGNKNLMQQIVNDRIRMKKLVLHIILTVILGLTAISCKKEDKPDRSCHRTVLVYIADNNNLNSYSKGDIKEMRQGVLDGALNGGRLLIFLANEKEGPALYEMIDTGELKLLNQYGDGFLSTDPEAFRLVCDDMRRLAPNEDYGLVLWSHSSGWLSRTPSKPRNNSGQLYSWGDDAGHTMTIPQLQTALEGQGFSFIYFDSCFMGNAESLYQLRSAAPVFVASPTEVLGMGMPYNQNLSCFFAPGKADLVNAAKNTFQYYESMTGSDRSCTIAVYNTSVFEELAKISRKIMEYNISVTENTNIIQYGYNVNGAYFDGYFYDMYQYLTLLCCNNPTLKAELDALWPNLIAYEAHTPKFWGRFSLEGTHGLSCFIYPQHQLLGSQYGYTYLDWFNNVTEPALKK